mgnify:CR=1 FL=1
MRFTLTIKKQKGILWGYLLFMNDLLIESGHSVAEIKGKIETAIQKYYELEDSAYQFHIETTQLVKARKMVARLNGNSGNQPLEIHFNPQYFT